MKNRLQKKDRTIPIFCGRKMKIALHITATAGNICIKKLI